jgi:hypothetical protein
VPTFKFSQAKVGTLRFAHPTHSLHKRLRVAPTKTNAFVADICKMLIKGIG